MFTYHEYNGIIWSCSDLLPVKHLFTGRLGGPGDWPYSRDRDPQWLAEDTQKRVRKLWDDLCDGAELPHELCFTHQVHGNVVRRVTEADRSLPPLPELPPDCDGLCTDIPGLPINVFTADCTPVLLCDRQGTAAAALHCGWKGTAKDMAGSGVQALRDMGVESGDIFAAIGPCISECCFEVGYEVVEAMVKLLGEDAEGTWRPEDGVEGKYMVDLKEVNRRRLIQLGVPAAQIDVSPDCTMCQSDRYWSHRATKGVRGTQASVIML